MKLIATVALLCGATLFGETAYVPKTYEAKDGKQLKYRLLVPADAEAIEGERLPLVLLLHGAGERGSDNAAQLRHCAEPLAAYCAKKKIRAVIAAPQCPKGQQWVNVPWGSRSHTMPEAPATSLRLALELVDHLTETMPIDPNRIYATGLSMGGYGVWDAISRRPQTFAAAVPVCGGADLAQAPKLTTLPIWIWHGDKDRAVPVSRSRDIVAAIKAAGGNPTYSELKGVGHLSWTPAFESEEMLDWLFSQRKNP